MARQKSTKKIETPNPAVATATPAVYSTNAQQEAAPAVAASTQPSTAKSATLESKNLESKNGDARKPEIGKPEIVKKEGRSNIVPINLDDEIRRLAYLLSERRGFAPGHEAEDWANAEREIRQRYHQQSA